MKVTKAFTVLLVHFVSGSDVWSYDRPATVKARAQQYEKFVENQGARPLSFRTHYQGGLHPTKFTPGSLGGQGRQYFDKQPAPRYSVETLSHKIEKQLGLVRRVLEEGGTLQGYNASTLSPTAQQGDFFVVTKAGQPDLFASCWAGLVPEKHVQMGESQVAYEAPKRSNERPSPPRQLLKSHSSSWIGVTNGQQSRMESEVNCDKVPSSPAAHSPDTFPPLNNAVFSLDYTDEEDNPDYSDEKDNQGRFDGTYMEDESGDQLQTTSEGGDYEDESAIVPPAQKEIQAFPDLPPQPASGGYSQAEREELSKPYHPQAWGREYAQMANFPLIKKNVDLRLRKGNPPPVVKVSSEEQEALDAAAVETLGRMKKTMLRDFDGLLKKLQGPLSRKVASFGKGTLVYFLNNPHHYAKVVPLATKFQEMGKGFSKAAIDVTPSSAKSGTHFVFKELCHLLYIGPNLENWCIKERILK